MCHAPPSSVLHFPGGRIQQDKIIYMNSKAVRCGKDLEVDLIDTVDEVSDNWGAFFICSRSPSILSAVSRLELLNSISSLQLCTYCPYNTYNNFQRPVSSHEISDKPKQQAV